MIGVRSAPADDVGNLSALYTLELSTLTGLNSAVSWFIAGLAYGTSLGKGVIFLASSYCL